MLLNSFALSFPSVRLTSPSSRLVVFGSPLAQLVQQAFSSLPPASSTTELYSTYTAALEELDVSLPRGWSAEARHSSTILHRGGAGAGSSEGAFDLSSLVESLPSAAPFATGEVEKPPATTMLVETVEHPSALMLGSKGAENWTKAVILVCLIQESRRAPSDLFVYSQDHVLNAIVHEHGGHPPSPQASSTSAHFQHLVLSAWEDACTYLIGYPDTFLVGGEAPQLLRWLVEASVATFESWAEHARQRGCAALVPSVAVEGNEDSMKNALLFVTRCRGAVVRAAPSEQTMEGEEGGLMIPLRSIALATMSVEAQFLLTRCEARTIQASNSRECRKARAPFERARPLAPLSLALTRFAYFVSTARWTTPRRNLLRVCPLRKPGSRGFHKRDGERPAKPSPSEMQRERSLEGPAGC
jgi:hypothetical protein